MFNLREFIKDMLNNGEDIDDSRKNYPLVIYENDIIRKEISNWVKFLGAKSFRQVLLDIGFNESDVVYIYGRNSDTLEYYYSVNDREINPNNYIKISYGAFLDRGSTIVIYNGNDYKDYEFIDNNFDTDKNSFMLSIDKKNIDVDDRCYVRNYYSNMSSFEIKDKEYEFIFDYGNMSSLDDVSRLIVNNEDRLCDYLCSLSFPVDVIDVYKNIINICDVDFSKYTFFEIKCIPNRVASKADVLSLRNGNFSELKMTKNGKRICLNCNDVWEYEMLDKDDLVRFSMNSSYNNVSYKVSGVDNRQIDDYTNGLLEYDISVARSEIDDTKKLVRSMFNNR